MVAVLIVYTLIGISLCLLYGLHLAKEEPELALGEPPPIWLTILIVTALTMLWPLALVQFAISHYFRNPK